MSYTITSLIVTPNEVPSYYKRLSICVNPNGFSFSRTTTQGIVLTFGEVQMDMQRPMSELADDLKQLFLAQRISPFDFEEMALVVPSDHTVWVPQELYSEGHDRDYLEALGSVKHGYEVFACRNAAVGACAVFTAQSSVVTAFRIVLPGIEVVCQHSVLCAEALLSASAANPLILLHRHGDRCDYEVCRDGSLLLSNTYCVRSNEELLFRTLQLMKQMGVESDKMVLLLAGEVDRDTYRAVQGFFPRITLYGGRPLRYINADFATLTTYRHVLALS